MTRPLMVLLKSFWGYLQTHHLLDKDIMVTVQNQATGLLDW